MITTKQVFWGKEDKVTGEIIVIHSPSWNDIEYKITIGRKDKIIDLTLSTLRRIVRVANKNMKDAK